ncbi:MAG TPA: patatin-like phospholipase family protein [Anaerolineales bacterium]|nr:patatin-like phospholipase family protein [Anaerolineales bacterium]
MKGVTLVIGSGSVKCAAALGVVRVLEREGIELDRVVGTSAGSIYAALIAMGRDIDEIASLSERLWTREITARRMRGAFLKVMFPRLMRFDERFGMLDDRLVMARLEAAFGDADIAETAIPLAITATDFFDGSQVILREGRIVDAIRGSLAIPYIFSPHRVGERVLIDGFMSDPMPVGAAIREGGGVIVAIGFDSAYQTRVSTILRYAFQLSSIMSNNLLRSNFAFHNLAHHAEVIPVIPVFEGRIRLFDTERLTEIIAAGERAGEEQIEGIRSAVTP